MAKLRYTASLISQGTHRFYSLTLPSDILARTTFVTTRYDDPLEGFQRSLDKNKAQQIADYIDNENGTIPTAIILSAQKECSFEYDRKNKTIEFNDVKKAFLILDGQHRVYGYALAKSSVRIPVIIYNDLSRREETRLFIDINTKQRPVPNELLLDIKALADYEKDSEKFLRSIFDLFKDQPTSALLGKLSAAEKVSGKISRVTFNSAVKPIIKIFGGKEPEEIYDILNNYLKALQVGFKKRNIEDRLVNSSVFKALLTIFPDVAQNVKDKYNSYTLDNFYTSLAYFFETVSATKLSKNYQGHKELSDYLLKSYKENFTL